MPPTSHRTKFFRHEYTVGWLCAVSEVELPAAMQMLDVFHEYPYDPVPGSDENTYTFGSINGHNVVIACLPPNSPGKVSAARLVAPLSQSFTNMKVHLFVGIGAGIPRTPSTTDAKKNIHLGDVVVGWPAETGSPVIVQYDFRYAESSDVGAQRLLGRDQTPDRRLLSVLGQLLAEYSIQRTKFPKIEESLNEDFQHPGLEHDRLYKSEYIHPNSKIDCSNCDSSQVVDRPKRQTKDFVFHRGTILSGDSFVAGADFRDKLANAHNTALCIEMEASGVIDQTRCLVIRGICDYADTHVNRIWQKYGAGTAAVFAKQFLHTLQPQAIEKFDAIPIIVKQPADRDKGFTARDDILEEIEAKFKSEHLVGLTGVGGVGKSHIALEYFHRFSNCKEFRDCSAIWIPSRTRARFIAEYRKLAENIGLKTLPDQAPKEVVRLVNDWLCQQDNEWLLVIDDAQFEISPPEDANSSGITEDLFTNDPKSPGITDEMEPLLRLSLVSPLQKLETKERSSDFQMIALVQAAIISWLRSENRFEASLETVLKVLSTNFEEGEFSNENQWKRYSVLVPHVDKVLRDFPPTKSNSDEMNSYRARLLRAYTKYLWRQGQLHQLENLCDQATNFHRDYIKDPRLLLQCEALKGSFYQSTGDLKKAEEVQSKVLSRREEKFGRDDPDTLSSRNDLAQVLRNRGELKRAKKEFREAFRGRRRKLGPENKYTLDSMSDLGQILCDLKQIPEAERRTQRALKLKKEHLGPQHPSTLATMLQLGHINAFKKDPEHIEAAKKLYQDAFDGFTAALGAEHRDTLIAQSYLADLLLQQKSPRDAGIIYSKVLAVSEKTFGDLDPETLTTMVYLATALRRDKDPRGAEEYYRKAFGKMVEMEKKLGVKHISLLVCLNGFIKVLQELVSSGSLNEEEKLSLSKELQELTTYREEYKATRSNSAGKRSQNHTGDACRAHYLPFFMRFLGYISTWNTEYKLF
ncbi:hypothetical protein TWF192_007309 [Orbilia oligospora]|nr:hypothetical protein TWF192_007309 [Orbilia oligospora]